MEKNILIFPVMLLFNFISVSKHILIWIQFWIWIYFNFELNVKAKNRNITSFISDQ